MEVIQKMSNESFSCGWHNNIKPSFSCLEASFRHSLDGSSFIEMDPDLFSLRWTDSSGFDFDLPSCDTSVLVHADQIFSDGILLPMHHVNPLRSKEAAPNSDSVLTRPVLLHSFKALLSQSNNSVSTNTSPTFCSLLGPSTESPGKFFRKYLYFLIPLCKKVKSLKRIVRSRGDFPRSSPRMSNAFSNIEWCRGNRVFDVDIESSIRDAVLHCKRSIEN